MNIGQNASIGNRHRPQKLGELLVVSHSELNMPRSDPVLLVVPRRITSQLQNLIPKFKKTKQLTAKEKPKKKKKIEILQNNDVPQQLGIRGRRRGRQESHRQRAGHSGLSWGSGRHGRPGIGGQLSETLRTWRLWACLGRPEWFWLRCCSWWRRCGDLDSSFKLNWRLWLRLWSALGCGGFI